MGKEGGPKEERKRGKEKSGSILQGNETAGAERGWGKGKEKEEREAKDREEEEEKKKKDRVEEEEEEEGEDEEISQQTKRRGQTDTTKIVHKEQEHQH